MMSIGKYIPVAMVILYLLCPHRAEAEEPFGFDTSLNVYTESPYSKLPLQSVHSTTRIDGPVAQSHIVYTFVDGMKDTMEVGLNFKLPDGAILNGFGYYYGTRFIKGKMYDNDQAWRIYTAVTSRGRDPGIMDRPSQQDYHTQIYPVLPGQFLRVVVDLTQVLPADKNGTHFALPLQQSEEVTKPVDIDSTVEVNGRDADDLSSNFEDHTTKRSGEGKAVAHLAGKWLPSEDWTVGIARVGRGVTASTYSRLPSGGGARGGRLFSPGLGAYTATISPPWPLEDARISLTGRADTRLASATRFGNVPAYGAISFSGRYRRSCTVYVTVHSANHKRFTIPLRLSSEDIADRQNPSAKLWADKRIAALQNASRDCRREIVRLSKRYTVVSNFTALLAIPQEELENYRKRLARHDVSTNTEYTGGGGGDPFIWVNAPADARNVVAVFPDGSAKSLTYDEARKSWTTRFDIPLGTPAGEYVVAIIVVRADGRRNRFDLVYQNLAAQPRADVESAFVSAVRGEPALVKVRADDVVKATLVAPWMERQPMRNNNGEWTGSVTVPQNWPSGRTMLHVVLYDGAHDRTEVSIDADVK